MKNDEIHVYTDGACSGNPGPGAAAALTPSGLIIHGEIQTTSNEMELLAVLLALKACPCGSKVRVFSDSKNAIQILSGKWRAQKGTMKALRARYLEIVRARKLTVYFTKVKGHSGHCENDKVDRAAQAEAKRQRKMLEDHARGAALLPEESTISWRDHLMGH